MGIVIGLCQTTPGDHHDLVPKQSRRKSEQCIHT